MKKIISVAIIILCLSFIACSRQSPSQESSSKSVSSIEISSSDSSSDAPHDEDISQESDTESISSNEVSPNESADTPHDEDNSQESDGINTIENISQEEQQNYFRKYIEPYYIVGLLSKTWTTPEEIDVSRFIKFYEYNAFDNYVSLHQEEAVTTEEGLVDFPVPADILESYVTSYFEVNPSYLRSDNHYDSASNCYLFSGFFGIGGGPGVNIERIEKKGDVLKFTCLDINENEYSVSIKIIDENRFFYISGN